MKISRQPAHLQLFFSICLIVCVFSVSKSTGKDLNGRIGLGATNLGPGFESPALSVDWQLNEATAVEVNFALDNQDTNNVFLLSARYARNLFIENHLHFAIFIGGGILSKSHAGSNASGYTLDSGVSAKFFLPNLPNLGLNLGSGFRIASPGALRIRTVAFAGFHYYF